MTRRPLYLTLAAATALAVALTFPGTAGARATPTTTATPSLSVHPASHLRAGSRVWVRLRGLPADTVVQFAQCDDRFDPTNAADGCTPLSGPLPTAETGPYGGLVWQLTLGDPLYLAQEEGDAIPIYCRADQCRVFAEWTDSTGDVRSASSSRLVFVGSPATITATPDTNLVDGQRVRTYGSAVGASGRKVVVVEEDCYHLVQGTGCEGTVTLGTTRVNAHGGWHLGVTVPRVLPDGIDCADPGDFILDSTCQLTARVLTWTGQPDDTFGVSRFGEPGAILSFAAPS
jgi:hypothetical protein